MSRVAVVGSGIAGLATAWLLSRHHSVVLFERDGRLGGHTHTHHLDTPDGPLALDTGFLVHNDRTYPLLVKLFDQIGIERLDSDMSFGVTCPRTGFEYSTRDLNGLFADRRNLLSPAHYRLLLEILRFNRLSQRLMSDRADSGEAALTLAVFLARHRFSDAFASRYLFPLASAIWSAPPREIGDFPAATLMRFFHNHGMNTAVDHPTWKVVKGGSAAYIDKLIAPSSIDVRKDYPVGLVRRFPDRVEIHSDGRQTEVVDEVVFACHGDEVLPLLADATAAERDVFSAFSTTANEAVLHTDESWLPKRPLARASWNAVLGEAGAPAVVTYDLNRLQGLHTTRRYCVTLNPTRPIAPYHVMRVMQYTHPQYTLAAVAAQGRWSEVSGRGRTHYCGAYWFYGFHEDGLRSAVRVANAFGVTW